MFLVVIAVLMALLNFNTKTNFTIPTPFGNRPFEFAVGFRKSYFMFPIAYFLTYQSIKSENFNLGVFSMILIALISLSYYTTPENEYFVWNFKSSAKRFLLMKVKTAFGHFSLLTLPIVALLSFYYAENIPVLLGFVLLCYLYLATMILAKYSAYPNEIGLVQGFLLAVSFLFIPILVGIIPFFYSQSIHKLNTILNDQN